ncbi:hypothetical protein AFCDBAGC_4694 [Methylobacterium cerastii]|uniref:Uncharacterized protein n=1 Tax=Methylobacterium cerastii TaxID=932741 RepID=A0ABQ4QPS9_9HYPH|nr:hypothetical protein [Methylobacterium cerastii]GJD46810.1 hypothetical protein AFCDBAGC_4694 [Methylobacterium cerastii]
MSATLPTERWSLLQAVAWVFTRDGSLVDDIGRAAAAGEPWTTMSLVVRTGLVESNGRTLLRDGWQPLAERIVARGSATDARGTDGTVRADGCPALNGAMPSHRQALTIEARDLHLDGERDAPGLECFLAGTSEAQRCWYDVEVIAADVERAFPGAMSLTPAATSRGAGGAAKTDRRRAVIEAISTMWPEGRWPLGYPAKRRNAEIRAHLQAAGVEAGDATIRRALKDRERD